MSLGARKPTDIKWTIKHFRKVWRYQRGNYNPDDR